MALSPMFLYLNLCQTTRCHIPEDGTFQTYFLTNNFSHQFCLPYSNILSLYNTKNLDSSEKNLNYINRYLINITCSKPGDPIIDGAVQELYAPRSLV